MKKVLSLLLLALSFNTTFAQKLTINGKLKNGFDVEYDSVSSEKRYSTETIVLNANVHLEYRRDHIHKVVKIIAVEFHENVIKTKYIGIDYNYPSLPGLKLFKELKTTSSKDELGNITSPANKAVGEILVDTTSVKNVSISEIKTKFRSFKTPRLYIELDANLGFSHRYLIVKAPKVDWQNVSLRQQRETAILGQNHSLKFGVNLNGSNNSIYVQGQWMRQGFVSNYKVDWNTGLTDTNPDVRNLNTFDYLGSGIGYSYSPYRRKINAIFDGGLYLNWLNAPKNIGFKKFTWGLYISPGCKFRINRFTDLRLMPSFYFNFEALKSSQVQTGLTNLGLTAGLRFYISKKVNKM